MKWKKSYSILLVGLVTLLIIGSVSAVDNDTTTEISSDTSEINDNAITSDNDDKISAESMGKNELKTKNKNNTYKEASNKNAQITLSNKKITYGQNITITANIKNTDGTNINNGLVQLYTDSINVRNTTVKNGIASFNIGLRNVGTYQIKTVYSNTNYNTITKTATLTVTKATAIVTTSFRSFAYGKNITLNANITSSTGQTINNGRIELYQNNTKIKSTTVKNGKATFNLGLRNIGIYPIKMIYLNNNYNSKNTNNTFMVYKVNATVKTEFRSFAYGKNITLNANVTTSSGVLINNGKVDLYLNGSKIRSVTPKNGKVTFNLGIRNFGNYPIKMIYVNKNYNTTNANNRLMVYKATPNLYISTSSYEYGQTIYVNARVTREDDNLKVNNGRIDLYLDNMKIKSQKVTNGNVKFNIGIRNAGYYNLEAKYVNNNYKQASASTTLHVEHLDSDIVLYDQSFYDNNNVKFYAYVSDNSYNPVNRGKVELYLNNKLIKTSKVVNGYANFNIGVKKIGNYNLIVKYIDNNHYGSTDTATLSVVENCIYVSNYGSDYYGIGTNDNPYETIEYAVEKASNNAKIKLMPGTYTTTGTSYAIYINKNLTIKSDANNKAVISTDYRYSHMFEVASGKLLKIENIIFKNNKDYSVFYNNGRLILINTTFNSNEVSSGDKYSSSIIENDKTLTIINCKFYDNSGVTGGALYNCGNAIIKNTSFNSNFAAFGSAIYSDYGTLKVYDSNITNQYGTYCAGIYNIISTVNLYNNRFIHNGASYGTCIWNENGTVTINNNTINNNYCGNDGVILNNYKLTITKSRINNNVNDGDHSYNWAGAICNDGIATITHTIMNNNTASDGGAIYNSYKMTLTNCTLNSNTASNKGGAILNEYILVINKSILNSNQVISTGEYADYDYDEGFGGAIYSNYNSTLKIRNSQLRDNSADYGGAIAFRGSDLDEYETEDYDYYYGFSAHAIIQNCRINDNYAEYDGAAIMNGYGIYGYTEINITNSEISNNYARSYYSYEYTDGTIIFNSGNMTIRNSKLTGNSGCLITDWMVTKLINVSATGNYARYGPLIMGFMYIYANNCTFKYNDAKYMFKVHVGQGDGKLVVKNSVLYNPKCSKEIYNEHFSSSIRNVVCNDNWWGTSSKPTKRVVDCTISTYHKGLK